MSLRVFNDAAASFNKEETGGGATPTPPAYRQFLSSVTLGRPYSEYVILNERSEYPPGTTVNPTLSSQFGHLQQNLTQGAVEEAVNGYGAG